MARGDWAHGAATSQAISIGDFHLDRHVIVCGYGRTGQRIAEFLGREAIAHDP